MNSNGIIGTAIGAVIGIKLLETGMKVIDKERKKVKTNGMLSIDTKKWKKFY